MPRPSGTVLSIVARNFLNSTARCWRWISLITVPSAVPDIVVGAPLGHAGHHRQHWLGPVQGLDLALLVYAQHHCLLRRVVVEPDHVDHFSHEQRVAGELEAVRAVRL